MPITNPLRRRGRRTLLLCAGLSAAAALLAAGVAVQNEAPEPERALTGEEVQRFALTRFSTYEDSPTEVRVTIPQGDRHEMVVHGLVDFRAHRAVGRYHVTDRPLRGSTGLVAWDAGGVGVAPDGRSKRPVTARSTDIRAVAKAAGVGTTSWSPRAYTTDPLDIALRMTHMLGTNRPENPQLLAQSGPRWLGKESIDGKEYDIVSGPRPAEKRKQAARNSRSPLKYWIGPDGSLRRVEVSLGGLPGTLRIDVLDGKADAKVPGTPWEPPGRRS